MDVADVVGTVPAPAPDPVLVAGAGAGAGVRHHDGKISPTEAL